MTTTTSDSTLLFLQRVENALQGDYESKIASIRILKDAPLNGPPPRSLDSEIPLRLHSPSYRRQPPPPPKKVYPNYKVEEIL